MDSRVSRVTKQRGIDQMGITIVQTQRSKD